ncbi:MAG: TIGR02996 domain-containing protein, partial [Myxococcales bacterium]
MAKRTGTTVAPPTPEQREQLETRLRDLLAAHYPPAFGRELTVTFRGATVALGVTRDETAHKVALLRWTGDPDRWRFGHWMGASYSHFWVSGRDTMPPEWGLAMGLALLFRQAPFGVTAASYTPSGEVEAWLTTAYPLVAHPSTSPPAPGADRPRPAPAPPATTGLTLLTAIHDDPDADGPRLAWADWLTAQGDPWGEVVRTAVGLAAKGRPPSRALVAAERTHRAAGLGPLADLFDLEADVTFDRGAFSGGTLVCSPPSKVV